MDDPTSDCQYPGDSQSGGYFWHRRRGESCDQCTAKMVAYNKARRESGYKAPPRPVRLATCKGCLATFETTSQGRDTYCTHTCFAQSMRTHWLVPHPNPPGERCDLPDQHPARQPPARDPWVFVSGPCQWCGTNFTVAHTTKARYCSRRCSRQAARDRRGRFAVPPATRAAIYERDGWVCQLCGDPVDKTLHPSDTWAATLDHIVCQSWTLVPDHTPSNLRLAHRWCNSVRADESFVTADELAA